MSTDPVKPPLALMREHPAWCVFPIKRGAKNPPLFGGNLALASSSPTQVSAWAAQWPGCNWGLALARSHLVVLDVDQKPGKRGRETLENLELEHGPLPRTFTVRTPNNGLHIYFSETNTARHRMKLNAFGRDVDSTNYVLLPGSVLDVGGAYRTIVNELVAPAPAWFAEYLDAPMIGDDSQVPAIELDTPHLIAWAIHYLRNDARPSIQFQNGEFALLMTAAVLKDHGISETMAIQLLTEHYNVPGRCEPLWDVGEGATADRLDIKVANAWNYLNQTQPGAHTAQVAFADDVVDAAALDAMVKWWQEFEFKQNYVEIDGERVRIVKGYGS